MPLPKSAHLVKFYAVSLSIVVSAFLPLALVLRAALFPFRRRNRISIWTGAPILNMTVNCRAERILGFKSYSCVRSSYYISDAFDFQLDRLAGGSLLGQTLALIGSFILICVLACQVHAYVDGGLLPSIDRRKFNPVERLSYRLCGIRLLVWTYGGDVRTRTATLSLGYPSCCSFCTQVGWACICHDQSGKAGYRKLAAQACAVFSMGDMTEYTPGSRNDLFFWPVDLSAEGRKKYHPSYPNPEAASKLRIVHAPNHREFKGTIFLEKAVRELQAEGQSLELVLVEKVPNKEAIEIYRSADLVFDQCLIGFHGYFALEAMALGKPVMCFIRKPQDYLLAPDECPIINTSVQTLVNDLRLLVEKRGDLEEIGRKGRSYIEKYYTVEEFAARLGKAYRDLGLIS